ncbi:MAG: serine/threonine protein kinase [Myxococcaceae bacterium]|nr:serine/threonine protein kinase [Myxococcaceae bacterium]
MTEAARKPVLLVAAESIALASGMLETVADVVRTRALKHYGEGLRQYLAIHLRSADQAEHAMEDLREALVAWTSSSLLKAPGPRAHLYKLAREIGRRHEPAVSGSCDLPWLSSQKAAGQSYADALARLRDELARDDAELLELHFARELNLEELAHVLDMPVAEVEQELELARAHALRMLGSEPPSRLGGLSGAIQEAFALAPSQPVRVEMPELGERGRRGLPEGTVIGERYAVQQRVGEGSFGDVYRAFDTDVPGHVVALKLLHRKSHSEEARKTALRELRLIASVFHPSVVDFKDHGWYDDRLWFVMPWYEGETLEDRIKREPLSREEAREIFIALAQALATMHTAGIRHQDVKPDNIFLARIGEVGRKRPRTLPVLLDLGVAAKDAEMIVAGTPLYFPPEIAAQYAGDTHKPKVTSKADVFSLALALRNALEPDTQEQVPGTAIEAFIAHRASSPPSGPKGREFAFLEPYFKRWLARDPELRPSAEELAEELDVLTRPEQARKRRRSILSWAAPITVGSMLGLSSLTYVYIKEREVSHDARTRAVLTMTKLDAESARRALLEESFQHSELTRQQLSERLTARTREAAQLDTQLARARREHAELTSRLQNLNTELDATRRDRDATQHTLEGQRTRVSVVEGQLFDAEQKRAFVESELRETRTRSKTAEAELDELRVRARTMLAELERARDETDAQLERATSLEETMAKLRREKNRLELELEIARRKDEPPVEERPVAPAPASEAPAPATADS